MRSRRSAWTAFLALAAVIGVGIVPGQSALQPAYAATTAISKPAATVVTGSSTFQSICTGTCDVSGFGVSDSLRVVVSATTGFLKLGTTANLTAITGYSSSNWTSGTASELGFVASEANANIALESLEYKGPAAGGPATIDISAVVDGAAFDASSGRFYEVVTVAGTIDWEDARCKAKYGTSSAHDNTTPLSQANDGCTNKTVRNTFNGLNGYLANITTADEQEFLRTKLTGTGWIGGADIDTEGIWEWVDGPEAGQVFFIQNPNEGGKTNFSVRRIVNVIDVVGGVETKRFNFFSDDEPNNSSNEDFAEFGYGVGGAGSWNDCRNGCNRTTYVVEYGGDGGIVTGSASASFAVSSPTAPLQVAGLTATAGNLQAVLSWSEPGNGGSAITDYVIEQSIDGTNWTVLSDGDSATRSYTVTGLTSGTEYFFRVAAKNVVNTGAVSTTVSLTARVVESQNNGGGSVAPTVNPVQPSPTPRLSPVTPQITPQNGPVFQNNQIPTPPNAPTSNINGVPTNVTTQVSGPSSMNIQAGLLNFGMNIPQGQGQVQQGPGGLTELQMQRGGRTTLQGGGLAPGSFVQVFLPSANNQSRELARIPVDSTGSFSGDVLFGGASGDAPMPVGRNVMQMVTVDERGRQAVVEMTVNVAQSAPTPEFNRSNQTLPNLTPGASIATRAGLPIPVTVRALLDQGQAVIEGDGWTMSVGIGSQGGLAESEGGASITFERNQEAVISGGGFMPGTRADIWLFSDPTLLGTVEVDDQGNFSGTVVIDQNMIPTGEHTLQMQGVGTDGYVVAANVGVLVADPVTEALSTTQASTGLLWWIWVLAALLLAVAAVVGVVQLRKTRAN